MFRKLIPYYVCNLKQGYVPLKSIQFSSKKFCRCRCRKIFVTFPEFSKDQNWQRSDLFGSQNNLAIFCRILSITMHWILFQIQIWIRQNIHFYFLIFHFLTVFFSFFHFLNSWLLSDKMRICKVLFYRFWHFIEIFDFFMISQKQRIGLGNSSDQCV